MARVIIFGATGMVGQGTLRESLLATDVERILCVGRSGSGRRDARLTEVVVPDVSDVASYETRLPGFDACFFCLGASSVGMSEADYRRVTYDMPVAIATALARRNPSITFVHVSGAGADTGDGRVMWARVKGQAESAILALPFKAFVFRPGYIQPMHGIQSRTGWLRALYAVAAPLYPVLNRLAPRRVTTTERIGRAMLSVMRSGYPKRTLENADINDAAARQ